MSRCCCVRRRRWVVCTGDVKHVLVRLAPSTGGRVIAMGTTRSGVGVHSVWRRGAGIRGVRSGIAALLLLLLLLPLLLPGGGFGFGFRLSAPPGIHVECGQHG